MPLLQSLNLWCMEMKVQSIMRITIQSISLYFLYPMLLPITYCPYKIPWVMCNSGCPNTWCPSKWLRLPTIYIIFTTIVISGRGFCGFLCPYGTLQDIINHTSNFFSRTKREFLHNFPLLKYFSLFLTLLIVASLYRVIPLHQNILHLLPSTPHYLPYLLALFLFLSAISYRVWCRYFCPVGAVEGFFNEISIVKLEVGKKCRQCGACLEKCTLDSRLKRVEPDSSDCIRCLRCMDNCKHSQISLRVRWKLPKF